MPNKIKPGDFTATANDYSQYANSMAEEIEAQLNRLLTIDGLQTLPTDINDREVRDRRRLFVAIARAVVKHLNDNRNAIDIFVPSGAGTTVNPQFDIDGTL